MPILKENLKLYPKNWKKIRVEILSRANDKCEKCGVVNYSIRNGKKVVLTIAHLNHNPKDNRRRHLQTLCQRCHNRHDIHHRVQTRRRLQNKIQRDLFSSQ